MGKIRVLYLGDTWGNTPFHKIRVEPSFLAVPVPASYKHGLGLSDAKIKRAMRLYLPRTYQGMGLMMVGGAESFGTEGYTSGDPPL